MQESFDEVEVTGYTTFDIRNHDYNGSQKDQIVKNI